MSDEWDDGEDADLLQDFFRSALVEKSMIPPPYKCPICSDVAVHVFFHRNRDDRGGGWVWCSTCRHYLHARAVVPQWWRNMPSVPEEDLFARPDYLDSIAIEIDRYVAGLQ